jgi:hypothetical protein
MSLLAPPGTKFKPPLEKNVQRACVQLLRLAGFRVYSTSQYRASHVAVGLFDLFCLHTRKPLALWWETKRPLARWRDTSGIVHRYEPHRPETWMPEDLSPNQRAFGQALTRAGQPWGWGELRALERKLIDLGLGRRLENGVFQLAPAQELTNALRVLDVT